MTSSKGNYVAETAAQQTHDLGRACEQSLLQCQQLLILVSTEDFRRGSSDAASIGAHVRHILERFQCFLDGLPDGCVDYDARDRDRSVEEDPRAAEFVLLSLLRQMSELQVDSRPLLVLEAVHVGGASGRAGSTMERELLSLISHTTHHLAMIAMLARSLGYSLDADFGKAAATIIHEQQVSSGDQGGK